MPRSRRTPPPPTLPTKIPPPLELEETRATLVAATAAAEAATAELADVRARLDHSESTLASIEEAAEADIAAARDAAAADLAAAKEKLRKAVEKGKGIQRDKKALEAQMAEKDAEVTRLATEVESLRAGAGTTPDDDADRDAVVSAAVAKAEAAMIELASAKESAAAEVAAANARARRLSRRRTPRSPISRRRWMRKLPRRRRRRRSSRRRRRRWRDSTNGARLGKGSTKRKPRKTRAKGGQSRSSKKSIHEMRTPRADE